MTARNHHYLPQCYLNGFAANRENPKLFAIDLVDRKSFWPRPRNVAAARDFNRVEIDGHEPDAVENALSGFESELGPALVRICEARSIANEEDRTLLLNLVGLAAMRTPRFREAMDDFQKRVIRQIIAMTVATPERWESTKRGARESGHLSPEKDLSYEEAKRFVTEGQFELEIPNTRHVVNELETFEHVLPIVFERTWSLIRSPPNANFITTDHPLCLVRRGAGPHPPHPPGLGTRNTDALFPISPELALFGNFEMGEPDVFDVSDISVAEFNGTMALSARRQLYARDDGFPYRLSGDQVHRHGAALLEDERFVRRPR